MRKVIAKESALEKIDGKIKNWIAGARQRISDRLEVAREIRAEYDSVLKTPKDFVSPYKSDPPFPVVVINNPSLNACETAVKELRDAFGDKVIIVQVVSNEKYKNPGADYALAIKDNVTHWADPVLVMTRLQLLAEKIPHLKEKLATQAGGKTIPPAFYCVWSSQAESPVVAKAARAAGFVWIGSSPEVVEKIEGKRAFKRRCIELDIPTAAYHEFKDPDPAQIGDEVGRVAYVRALSLELLKTIQDTKWDGADIFIKSDWGGGGRGSKRLEIHRDTNGRPMTTLDEVIAVVNQVASGVANRLDGLYFEKSMLAPKGSNLEQQLYQLELEVVGVKEVNGEKIPVIAYGGRLVEFTPEFQKCVERGFSDEAIGKVIDPEVYATCRQAIFDFAKSIGYDNRGTMEFLLVKTKDAKTGEWTWDISSTEMNCRRQVEAKCNSRLVYYSDLTQPDKSQWKELNVTAGQFMASAGYAPPEIGVHAQTIPNVNIVVHLRITNSHPGEKEWSYGGGYLLGHAGLPEWAQISLIPDGEILQSKDAQLGCITFTAATMEEALQKQAEVANKVRIMGANGEELCVDLWAFHRKLAANADFKQGRLSSNETSRVVRDPNMPSVHALVSRLGAVVNGWVNGFVPKGSGYPSEGDVQLAAKVTLLPTYGGVKREPETETPYAYLVKKLRASEAANKYELRTSQKKDLADYYQAKRARLTAQGGGINDVTRDSCQQRFGSQSGPLMQAFMAIVRQYGPEVFEFYEAGGAQQDVMAKLGMDPLHLFDTQIGDDMEIMSLIRSRWFHSLYSKSEEEQALILDHLASRIRTKLGLPEGSFLPVTFNNFHAGNHASQDVTTRLMLEAGFRVIPNFVFNFLPGKEGQPDRGFTPDHARIWITRQLDLFKSAGLPLEEVRIKNPGQGPGWTPERVMVYLDTFADEFKKRNLQVPIFHIHNHDANGKSTQIACEVLEKCQRKGYLLVVDTGVPGVTHNDNTLVADKLTLTPDQRTALADYNKAMQAQFALLKGFDNEEVRKRTMPEDTPWALGTTTSDLLSAKDLGIAEEAIPHLLQVALDVFGCFGVVTPFSEILKSFAFSFPAALDANPGDVADIKSKVTADSIRRYIESGGNDGDGRSISGIFDVDQRYVIELQRWESLVDRPGIVDKLLTNYGVPLREAEGVSKQKMDMDQWLVTEKARLNEKYPNLVITDEHAVIALSWGIGGESYLARLNTHSDLDMLSKTPWQIYEAPREHLPGEVVEIDGRFFRLESVREIKDRAQTVFNFVQVALDGRVIDEQRHEVRALNRQQAIELGLMRKVILAAGRYGFFGSKSGGSIQEINFKEGQILKEGDELYKVLYCKMLISVKVPKSLDGKTIAEVFLPEPPAEVSFDEQLFRVVD